jgi:hypothetical protein
MSTKRELGEAIALLRAEYDDMKPIDGARLEMWWEALRHFPDGSVKASAIRHLKTSHFKPQLADIVKGCEAQIEGQWLGADEAWALMPKSESDSAMLTDEIAQAMAAASTLIEGGDKVAARMAFKDAYNRLVEKAKTEGRGPRFFPSFGSDAAGRVSMMANAVQKGQITLDAATHALPEYGADIVRMCGVSSHPLLAAPTEEGKAKVKALLANLKQLTQGGS